MADGSASDSGAGVSVLLRQPHGFEGLLERFVGRRLHGSTMSEPEGMALPEIRAHAAALPSHTKVDGDGRAVLALDDPLHVELKPLPGGAHRVPEVAHA